jgi:hypothetical protein
MVGEALDTAPLDRFGKARELIRAAGSEALSFLIGVSLVVDGRPDGTLAAENPTWLRR